MTQNVDAFVSKYRDMNLLDVTLFWNNLWDSYAIIFRDVKHFDSLVEPQIDLESERFAVDICDFGVL